MEEDQEKELLKRLLIAHADLQQSLSAITFLDESIKYSRIDLRRFKCFETTFVVAYGRAFTSSKGRYDKLSLKRIGVALLPDEREMHRLISKLRQTEYAHSDENFAHVRMDVIEMDVGMRPFNFPHLQFDHGMRFAEPYKRRAAIDLTRKIMSHLLLTVRDIAERSSEQSLYMRPQTIDFEWKCASLVRGFSLTAF